MTRQEFWGLRVELNTNDVFKIKRGISVSRELSKEKKPF